MRGSSPVKRRSRDSQASMKFSPNKRGSRGTKLNNLMNIRATTGLNPIMEGIEERRNDSMRNTIEERDDSEIVDDPESPQDFESIEPQMRETSIVERESVVSEEIFSALEPR